MDPGSVSLILLTIFDAVIVFLTVVEYRKRKHLTAATETPRSAT